LSEDLETQECDNVQAETILSALTTKSIVSLGKIYKKMNTQAQQEHTV
ncbi:hypothetical protein DBR06_SOUSAS8510032, partial [Sousa chinensis]